MSSASSNIGPNPSTKTILTDRVPFGWWQALLLVVIVLAGFDIIVNFLFGVTIGFSQVLVGDSNPLTRQVESSSIILNFSLFALSRTLALVFVYRIFKRSGRGWGDLGLRNFSIPRFVGLFTVAIIVFLAVSYGIFTVLDQAVPSLNLEQEQDIVFTTAQTAPELIMSFAALVIIAPIAEEVLFRGVLFPALMKRFGIWASAIVTSAIFGAIHLQANVAIVTFVMGLLMAWLYYRLRSLWPAIMFHSLKNLVAFLTIFKLF